MSARTLESLNPFSKRLHMKETLVKVYLQPKSSKNEIVGPYRDGIKVKVTAPPIEGKANKALIRFLAKELGVSPSKIEILKGLHSREKILRISESLDQEWVKKIL
jgi:uncharacterized protein (TIGR00251 family)